MTEAEMDAEVARIMRMSDAEIDAHIRAQGDDPAEVVRRFDIILRNAITITKLRNAINAARAQLYAVHSVNQVPFLKGAIGAALQALDVQ